MTSARYWTNTLSWTLIVLNYRSNISRVDMSLHSDILFPFQANLIHLLNISYIRHASDDCGGVSDCCLTPREQFSAISYM